ncbi:MmcQ/YjbR family DNA-binding protein [Bacillus sp. JCM 19041]|uniref:MmcQ/YjbR family DNA-binding protein n=1 Tax=Bacillus sp. JCM 19041 TaxID=1460637 RepID=UPI0006D21E2E
MHIDIIDLRTFPKTIEALVDKQIYFPGYHMIKTHWYTICLDGSVPVEEICQRIDESYRLATK